MEDPRREIMETLFGRGASLVGFADLGDVPDESRLGMPRGISIAVALSPGVVSGIGGYGNCVGVPTVAGDRKRRSAAWRLLAPSATSEATRCSAGVSASQPCAARRRFACILRRCQSTRARPRGAVCGSRTGPPRECRGTP